MFCASTVVAQSKFFSTPGRGAEGAKQNAQVTTLQGENERMNACTVQGRIYAPTHPNRDSDDCIPHLTLNPSTGAATFTNDVTVQGSAAFNTTLNVVGTSTFGNNMTVDGRVTAGQLFVGSGNVGNIPTCSSAQKLQWNGVEWGCVADNIGATAATEVDPKIGTLTNGRWCRTNGAQVICDVNVPVACAASQKLQWNGSSWSCVADQGIMAETDPKVGALTNGKWCIASGGQVVCNQDAPSGGGGGGVGCSSGSGNCAWAGSGTHGQVKTGGCSCGGSMTCQCNNGMWIYVSGSCFYCSGGDDDFGDW